MDTQHPALERIKTLFNHETLAVLSTQKNGQPYASLVAFSAGSDLSHITFLTPSTTRKYDNLMAAPKVALLVNNSRNLAEDIYNAVSVTATGTAREVTGDEKKQILAPYLTRHPHMKAFASAPTTAVISVTINRYFMVSRFQNVIEIEMPS